MAATAPGLILVKRTSRNDSSTLDATSCCRLCSCRTRTDQVRASKRVGLTPGLRSTGGLSRWLSTWVWVTVELVNQLGGHRWMSLQNHWKTICNPNTPKVNARVADSLTSLLHWAGSICKMRPKHCQMFSSWVCAYNSTAAGHTARIWKFARADAQWRSSNQAD